MQVLIVIGGIGSGKSSVVKLLGKRGLPTLDLDRVGHKALRDSEVKKSLAVNFGDGVFDKEKNIDREALAQMAFASDEATAVLDEITRPWIYDYLKKWLTEKAQVAKYAVVEVSAFTATDRKKLEDMGFTIHVIAVTAPADERIKRACAKGFDRDDVTHRIARQPSDEDRIIWSDYVIENVGSLKQLEKSVHALMEDI